ncbi:hypothetical protein HAX54_015721 [Datura stramonium]|uniref:1-phosphatidylinositol-4-phosphate 5-kinase n=1 Tax=Datura stramonium TaxID=4076 RepID=A0ABS8UKG5_DATST|nr:hypothetical protein [Datura stramonium]
MPRNPVIFEPDCWIYPREGRKTLRKWMRRKRQDSRNHYHYHNKYPASGTTSTSGTTSNAGVVEKHLPNGDLEWKRGKASGKGKFSWPSGATFEGEFKSGRMEGSGTFIGSDGDMYKGSWSADRKHGYGQKHYSNGDYYEGHWKRNLQDGQGRYVWKNGNEYVGEWKNGDIHGRGVLIWANGNRYDGNWEAGGPRGHGVSTWPDGSCYIGAKEDVFGGFFGHKLTAPLMADEDCGVVVMNMGKKRSSVDGARGSMTERNFPRICIWESDEAEASMIYRDGFGFDRDGLKQFRRNPCCFSKEEKKPGQTISKGHKNYDLMLNLQLGIRYSVGKHASILRDLKPSDFDPNEKLLGPGFHPKGPRLHPLINLLISVGRIIAQWCLGIHFLLTCR